MLLRRVLGKIKINKKNLFITQVSKGRHLKTIWKTKPARERQTGKSKTVEEQLRTQNFSQSEDKEKAKNTDEWRKIT